MHAVHLIYSSEIPRLSPRGVAKEGSPMPLREITDPDFDSAYLASDNNATIVNKGNRNCYLVIASLITSLNRVAVTASRSSELREDFWLQHNAFH